MKRAKMFGGSLVWVVAAAMLVACAPRPSTSDSVKVAKEFWLAYLVMDRKKIQSMMTPEGWEWLQKKNPRGFGIARREVVRKAIRSGFKGLEVDFAEKARSAIYLPSENRYFPQVVYQVDVSSYARSTRDHPLVYREWTISVVHDGKRWRVADVE